MEDEEGGVVEHEGEGGDDEEPLEDVGSAWFLFEVFAGEDGGWDLDEEVGGGQAEDGLVKGEVEGDGNEDFVPDGGDGEGESCGEVWIFG